MALRDGVGLQRRMLNILMNGVSRRSYQQVIPQMADSVGISKSTVSRQTIAAAEKALAELLARRWYAEILLLAHILEAGFGASVTSECCPEHYVRFKLGYHMGGVRQLSWTAAIAGT